jgi:hypothetical protein
MLGGMTTKMGEGGIVPLVVKCANVETSLVGVGNPSNESLNIGGTVLDGRIGSRWSIEVVWDQVGFQSVDERNEECSLVDGWQAISHRQNYLPDKLTHPDPVSWTTLCQ